MKKKLISVAGAEAAEGGPVVEAVRVVLTGGGGGGGRMGEEPLLTHCWGPEEEDATAASSPSHSHERDYEDTYNWRKNVSRNLECTFLWIP